MASKLEAAGQNVRRGEGGEREPRGQRVAEDMARIRGIIVAEDVEMATLVSEYLTDDFTAMAKSTRNHPSEFLPASPKCTEGGRYCSANTTPELREATSGTSGTPITSTDAETLFAAVKRRAQHLRRPRRPRHHPRR